jgi:NADPH-dependent ferric siderophore reductase
MWNSMTQQIDVRDRWRFPLPQRLVSIAGVRPLELEVVAASDLGPHMRRIVLGSEDLQGFSYEPGQDLMLVLSGGERPLSRRYTIRRFDAAEHTLELNIVAHGVHGPGAEWANSTRPGDRVNGVGPRGKIFVDRDAEWHLWLGDESAAPGALHMLESLPPGVPGQAVLEVPTPADELATPSEGVTWLYRGDLPAIQSAMLVDAMTAAELPEGRGHVYIAGEVQIVAAVLRAALARGLAQDQISPKAYWGRGKSNELNGEPSKEDRAVLESGPTHPPTV